MSDASRILKMAAPVDRTPPTRWIAVLATAVACFSCDEPTESHFVSLGEGVVRDSRTGLVWTSRDSDQVLNWSDADEHCRGLAPASNGAKWRLPSTEELASLYDTSMEQPCGGAAACRIDPAIDLSVPYQWSATTPNSNRRTYYDFAFGTQLSPWARPTLTRGTLCTSGEQADGP
jgi:hypothetical protein